MSTHLKKENISSGKVYRTITPVPDLVNSQGIWYVRVVQNGTPNSVPLFDVYPENTLVFASNTYYIKPRAELTMTNKDFFVKYFDNGSAATEWETGNLPTEEYIDLDDEL